MTVEAGAERATALRRAVYETIEATDNAALPARLFRWALVTLILINVLAAILESVPSILADYETPFRIIERVSLIIFAIEYVVRLWVAVDHPRYRGWPAWKARFAYAMTPAAIIDLIAISPFVASHLFGVNFRTIILLRLLRLFKLARYSTGFQSLFEAIRRERHALVASLGILAAVVLISASLMYALERNAQPDVFGTIPEAMWWAITTVTTVGYGDVVPKTSGGRILGGLTMIAGIVMLALPVAIIATSFADVIRRRSFLINYAMVSRLPVLASLGAEDVIELLPVLRAVTVESGVPILQRGDDWSSLYVVAEGVVDLDTSQGRRRLVTGEAFGGIPYLKQSEGARVARASSRVRLLALDAADFQRLVESRPDFANRLSEIS